MSDIRNQSIRFSGYRHLSPAKTDRSEPSASLFLPGYTNLTNPVAQIRRPGDHQWTEIPLYKNESTDSWESIKQPDPAKPDNPIEGKTVPVGTAYRFFESEDQVPKDPTKDECKPLLEALPVHGDSKNPFHKVEKQAPKSGPILHVFQDSLPGTAHTDDLLKKNQGFTPIPNHYSQFKRPDGNALGLYEMIPQFAKAGYQNVLLTPFIGGDNTSQHGYWTNDPTVLNNSFRDKAQFRFMQRYMMRHGLKLFADGAFVNQGLTGVQMSANRLYGHQSPYWNWFQYDKEHQPGIEAGKGVNPWFYPSQASENEKLTYGLLPTKKDEQGHESLDYSRFEIKIHNAPGQPHYDSRRLPVVELLVKASGMDKQHPKTSAPQAPPELSTQSFRFEVWPQEVQEKSKTNHQPGSDDYKKLMLEWKTFRFDLPSEDDSGKKWDGNVHVALLNTKNAEVKDYLKKSVGYWSRSTKNNLLDTTSRALVQALQKAPPAAGQNEETRYKNALETITQQPNNTADLEDPLKVLPPITLPQREQVSLPEIKALLANVSEAPSGGLNAEQLKASSTNFSKQILDDLPLSILPLPTFFKGIAGHPALLGKLQGASPSLWHRIITIIYSPFINIETINIGKTMTAIRDWLSPPAFQDKLALKLSEVIQALPAAEQGKMGNETIRSLMLDKVGEALLLNLFTELSLSDIAKHNNSSDADEMAKLKTPQANTFAKDVEKAFYATVPTDIVQADPTTGMAKLNSFLRSRLDRLDVKKTAELLEASLKGLDPKSVALANAVLDRRQYGGLHWRIDAAKDVGDMARIRNADPSQKARFFDEEMKHVQAFWNEMRDEIRKASPSATLIAELTDFIKLSDNETAKKWTQKLFNEGTFNGAPNMDYIFSGAMQAINYDQRPDQFGGKRLKPSEFLERIIQPMTANLPFSALLSAQNMVSSHDHATASHSFLVNTALSSMDQLKHWGLKEYFDVTCQEIASKACFKDSLTAIGKANKTTDNAFPELPPVQVQAIIQGLGSTLQQLQANKAFSPEVQTFYDEASKKSTPSSTDIQTPSGLKGRLIDELFSDGTNDREWIATAKLSPAGRDALKELLKARMVEPSSAKAMRGAIVNSMLALDSAKNSSGQTTAHDNSPESVQANRHFWSEVKSKYSLTDTQLNQVLTAFQSSLWTAIDRVIQQQGTLFGDYPLRVALQQVFANMDNDWQQGLPSTFDAKGFKAAMAHQLEVVANRPVHKRLLRLSALLNALPGNPSKYLADELAQGGGEWTGNAVLQNRGLSQVDKLDPTKTQYAEYQAFAQRAGAINRTRSYGTPDAPTVGPGALNNGLILNGIQADDKNGVLPIVRDNGLEQVITLIHVGPSVSEQEKIGKGESYAALPTGSDVLKNYQTPLRQTGKQVTFDRIYADSSTGERFLLNPQGVFEKITSAKGATPMVKSPTPGIDIQDFRILIREPK